MRPRPFLALEHVRLLVPEPSSYAFPSGHTTSSFAVASGAVLSARRFIGKVPIWGWGMLGLAALISYSRIYVGVHWPTDVAAGALLELARVVLCAVRLPPRRAVHRRADGGLLLPCEVLDPPPTEDFPSGMRRTIHPAREACPQTM